MVLETINSCICGNKNSELLFSTKDFRLKSSDELFNIVRCTECEIVYLKNILQKDNLYPENFYKYSRLSDIITKLAHKNIVRVLKKIKPYGKVLDIGAGAGIFLDTLKKYGYDAYGIETSPHGYKLSSNKHGNKIYNRYLKECEFPDAYFDIITLFHVLEHIQKPIDELIEIKRILKPDGLLIIEVPNIDSLGFKIFKKYWISIDSPRHIFHFNYFALTKILTKNGFYIIRNANLSRFFDSPLSLVNSLKNYLEDTFTNKTIVRLILYTLSLPLVLLNTLSNLSSKFSPVVQVYCRNK